MSSVLYRKDIQGLRAIAVLAVMAFHLNPNWLPGGFIGVDVFLVISGFLITSILLHKKNNKDYSLAETLKYFYISRFKRIAPAYFAMLIVVALLAAVLFLPNDFNTFRKGLEKAAWFNSNHYFAGFGDFFDHLGKELGFKARIITASSCVTISEFDYQRLPEWAHKPCQNQIAAAMPYLTNSDLVVVAGMWSYQTQSPAFINAFEKFLHDAALKNKKIIMLSQIPLLTQSPQRIQRFNKLGFVNRAKLDPAYQTANQVIEATTKKYPQTKYLALDGLPVFAEAPFYNGQLFYYDGNHLNESSIVDYVKQALPMFKKIFIAMEQN